MKVKLLQVIWGATRLETCQEYRLALHRNIKVGPRSRRKCTVQSVKKVQTRKLVLKKLLPI